MHILDTDQGWIKQDIAKPVLLQQRAVFLTGVSLVAG
jgi:hypothetical protein